MEFKNEDRCVPIHYSDVIAERFVPSAVPFRGLWACGEVVKEGSIVKVWCLADNQKGRDFRIEGTAGFGK